MNIASPELLRVLRNRTPPTIPARENANASELCTITTIAVTAMGKTIMVSTSAWSYSLRLRLAM